MGVQNVSRVQQDLFELSRDLDQKANMVDVTALRSDLAQKANADSVTQMQAQVDTVQDAVLQKASVQNLSRLEVVVRGKASESDLARKANETTVEAVRAQLAAAEAQLRQKADGASTPRFSDLPVLPNLLQDTKHLQQVCHGEVGVETPWADAWSSPWVLDWSHSAAVDAASSTVEVVDMTSQARRPRWTLATGRSRCESRRSGSRRFLRSRCEGTAAHCADPAGGGTRCVWRDLSGLSAVHFVVRGVFCDGSRCFRERLGAHGKHPGALGL